MKSLLASAMGVAACARPSAAASQGPVPPPSADLVAEDSRSEASVVLAGGCFWCVEAVFEAVIGVKEVVSGFAGGTEDTADYRAVSSGATGHAEVVRIVYDPKKISYGALLQIFFSTHDPTTKDRQGPDSGRQYRSAIFFASEEERRVAEAYLRELDEKKVFPSKIVTTLEPLRAFHSAEAYHQDFVARNPNHPYVMQWSLPKLEKLVHLFPERTSLADGEEAGEAKKK